MGKHDDFIYVDLIDVFKDEYERLKCVEESSMDGNERDFVKLWKNKYEGSKIDKYKKDVK